MFDGRYNRFQNPLPVAHDVMIVEAQNTEAFAGKISFSPCIAQLFFRFEMLSAIDLDNKTSSVTDEVHDVWPDWRLTTKTRSVHAMSTQCRPNDSLGIGEIRAQ